MGKVYFTGDLHFGHENVLAFDNRPFKTVEEMDAELIRRWNSKVGKGDLTYVLGDMIWKARNDDAPELIKSLNGQIILISEVMYYFWAKCEWEVLITPWVGGKGVEDKKVDVCWQIMNNWDVFVDYVWNNRKKL